MKNLIKFGSLIIWCIFSCGCNSHHLNNKHRHNLEQYYLEQYTDSIISKAHNTSRGNWRQVKEANINAQKNWNAYLRSRLDRESTYKLSHISRNKKQD